MKDVRISKSRQCIHRLMNFDSSGTNTMVRNMALHRANNGWAVVIQSIMTTNFECANRRDSFERYFIAFCH